VSTTLKPIGGTTASWPGRADYFVPPGFDVHGISLTGPCSGGLCSNCVPPPTAYVRVASTSTAFAWTVTSDVNQVTRAGTFDVLVDTSDAPYVEAVETSPGGLADFEKPYVYDRGMKVVAGKAVHRFGVMLTARAGVKSPAAQWTARGSIYGLCAGSTACDAPAASFVNISVAAGSP
jgi:hypothetical protein